MNRQINKHLLICRTCLCIIEGSHQPIFINNRAKTLNYENMLITDIIEKCVPELDLDICDHAVICSSCYDLLISTYEFKSKCFQTEEKIYSFVEANNLTLGDKIDLTDLVEDSHFKEYSKFESTVMANVGNAIVSGVKDIKSESETFVSDSEEGSDQTVKKESCIESMVMANVGNAIVSGVKAIKSGSETIVSASEEGSGQTVKKSKIRQKQYLKREYSCDKCEYKGYRRDLLRKHLLFKCKNRNKFTKYECDMCPYTTIRLRHLTRHKLIHGGPRPYICGICNKGFTEKTTIRYHIMYKHSGVQLPYKCGEGDCRKAFARKCDLNAHIVKHID